MSECICVCQRERGREGGRERERESIEKKKRVPPEQRPLFLLGLAQPAEKDKEKNEEEKVSNVSARVCSLP